MFLTDGSRHPLYFHRKNRRPTSRPGRRHTHTQRHNTCWHPLWLQQHNLLLLFFTCLNSRGAQIKNKKWKKTVQSSLFFLRWEIFFRYDSFMGFYGIEREIPISLKTERTSPCRPGSRAKKLPTIIKKEAPGIYRHTPVD